MAYVIILGNQSGESSDTRSYHAIYVGKQERSFTILLCDYLYSKNNRVDRVCDVSIRTKDKTSIQFMKLRRYIEAALSHSLHR